MRVRCTRPVHQRSIMVLRFCVWLEHEFWSLGQTCQLRTLGKMTPRLATTGQSTRLWLVLKDVDTKGGRQCLGHSQQQHWPIPETHWRTPMIEHSFPVSVLNLDSAPNLSHRTRAVALIRLQWPAHCIASRSPAFLLPVHLILFAATALRCAAVPLDAAPSALPRPRPAQLRGRVNPNSASLFACPTGAPTAISASRRQTTQAGISSLQRRVVYTRYHDCCTVQDITRVRRRDDSPSAGRELRAVLPKRPEGQGRGAGPRRSGSLTPQQDVGLPVAARPCRDSRYRCERSSSPFRCPSANSCR